MFEKWPIFYRRIKDTNYLKTLMEFLDYEYSHFEIYPPRENLFKAFDLVSEEDVKVVIIGQDPYHEPNQAMGLAFSVPSSTPLPPSLKNIYKEIENEYGVTMKEDGDLTYLAKQGVLLINAYLTVRAHQALSHKRKEYEMFMYDLLKYIDSKNDGVVYMLWGNFAQQYEKYLFNKNNLVIESTHPSPLGANKGGWFNMGQFKKCNDYLIKKGREPIDWIKK